MLVRLIAALRHVDKAKSAVEASQAELQRAEVDLAEVSSHHQGQQHYANRMWMCTTFPLAFEEQRPSLH